MPRCRPHPTSTRFARAALRRCPAAPADTPRQSSAKAFRAPPSGRIPSPVAWSASSPRLPPRTHPRSPALADIRADNPVRPDRPPDARKSSRPLRTATPLSIADRSPPRALVPPRSSLPWRHSPMLKPAPRSPPTIALPLRESPVASLPHALPNHSLHYLMTTRLRPKVYSASPFPSTFLSTHRSRINSHDSNAHRHHTRRQPVHRPLRTLFHRSRAH